jgi:arylsulfatase
LAGRRHDAVPQREKYQLGGRIPRAVSGAMAEHGQARHSFQRVDEPQRLDSDSLCAVAGEPDIVNKLKAGYTANGINYKVHLDGYNQLEFLRNVSGTAANNNGTKSARDRFFYSNDDGLLVAYRRDHYKYVFSEQRMAGTMGLWAEPFTTLRLQKVFNIMQDPFERADFTSNTYWDWQLNHVAQMYGVIDEIFQFVETFKEFPPRSFPPSFNPANIMESTLEGIKEDRRLKEGLDVDRIRDRLNRMMDQRIRERSIR